MYNYNLALFIHLVGVVGMFAGVALAAGGLLVAQRSRETAVVRSWMSIAAVADKTIALTALVVLGSAIYMVNRLWDWDDGWIVVSLVVFAIQFVLGPTVDGRRMDAIRKLSVESPDGPVAVALTAKLNDPILNTSMRTMTLVMFGVIYIMVMRPGLGDSIRDIVVSVVIGLATSAQAMIASRGPHHGSPALPAA